MLRREAAILMYILRIKDRGEVKPHIPGSRSLSSI
jgi:hypothetical protein